MGLVYDVVCGAVGNSWMFGDQEKRMIANGGVNEGRKKKVMSLRLVTLLYIAHYFYNSYIFFAYLSPPKLFS